MLGFFYWLRLGFMSMNWFNQSLRCLYLIILIFITACTDGIPLTPADNRGWIEVTQPTSESVYTTTEASVALSGDAFIFPSDDPEKLDITWLNAANDTQGTGVSNVGCIDLVTVRGCFSDWSIALGEIALELGNNLITITAADDKGNRGRVSINVRRLATASLNIPSDIQIAAPFNPLILTDVNGDNELDVIALNLEHHSSISRKPVNAEDVVVVFLAGGDKGLRQSDIINTNSDPRKIAVCDINGDELVDMIIYNDAEEAALFTGNGDGSFDSSASLSGTVSSEHCPDSYGSAALNWAVDLNADELPDLISFDPESKQLVVKMGGESSSLFSALNQDARFAVSADINNDGAFDLVTLNSGPVIGSISLLMGQGDGTFAAEQIFMFEK